jgi:hypothetical protein
VETLAKFIIAIAAEDGKDVVVL